MILRLPKMLLRTKIARKLDLRGLAVFASLPSTRRRLEIMAVCLGVVKIR